MSDYPIFQSIILRKIVKTRKSDLHKNLGLKTKDNAVFQTLYPSEYNRREEEVSSRLF